MRSIFILLPISLVFSGCVSGLFARLSRWLSGWKKSSHVVPDTGETSALDTCAHHVFETSGPQSPTGTREMTKEAQRVLWDFGYGKDLVLDELRGKEGINLHIHAGPDGKKPTNSEGIYFYKWKNGECMKIVLVASNIAVEVLCSKDVPGSQIGLGVCGTGKSAPLEDFNSYPELIRLISEDIKKSQKIDQGAFAASTVAAIDIAKIATNADVTCASLWTEDMINEIKLTVNKVSSGLIPRVVLVYVPPVDIDSSSVKSARTRQSSSLSLVPAPPSIGLSPFKRWKSFRTMTDYFSDFNIHINEEAARIAAGVSIKYRSAEVPLILTSDSPGIAKNSSAMIQLMIKKSINNVCFIVQGYLPINQSRLVYTTMLIYNTQVRRPIQDKCGDWQLGFVTVTPSEFSEEYDGNAQNILKSVWGWGASRTGGLPLPEKIDVKAIVMSDQPL